MRFLPIVERELRVAVHQRKTWWRRVFTLLGAFAVCGFTYLVVARWTSLSRIGSNIFSALGGFGVFYALLAGPLATVDCLSRERREGTLGLLFLTNLQPYDVVLGKMAAASFDMLLGLTAILPLLALPLLVGGINLAQFARLALGLADIMALSLAVGVLASTASKSSRTALAIALGILLFLCLGLPLLGEKVFALQTNSTVAPFFYSICPFYMAGLCLDAPFREPLWKYWCSLTGMHAFAWVCLAAACSRTKQSWRDQPASAIALRWSERLSRWRKGSARLRLRWSQLMLEKNPVAWLEGRDRLHERVLWSGFLLVAMYWALRHLYSPEQWPKSDALILWPWWTHCILCVWLIIQAPRRFADDKHSGALELLLCTPLSPREIVRGNMLALRRRYGRVLLGLVTLYAFLVFAYFSQHDGWHGLIHHDESQLFAWGLVIFPLQFYSLARIGLYQALVHTNSVRASFAALWRVGLLPWILFFVFILVCNYYSTRFRVLRVSETLAYASWGVCHLVCCSAFLAWSNWQLSRRFRALATGAPRLPWYRRLADWLRKPAWTGTSTKELQPG